MTAKLKGHKKGSQQPTFNFTYDIIAECLRVNERFNFKKTLMFGVWANEDNVVILKLLKPFFFLSFWTYC